MCSPSLRVLAFLTTAALLAPTPPAQGGGGGANPAIVYLKTTKSRTDLYVMDADGTDRMLVRAGVGRGGPVWSPNGLQIAFVTSSRVYVCNRDGSGLVQVGQSSEAWPGVSWSPVPAPDGHYRIAYHSTVAGTGSSELFLVDPNGQNTLQLTATPGIDEYAMTWSRNAGQLAVATWDDFGTHIELLTLGSPSEGACTVTMRQTLVSDPSFNTWFSSLDWGRVTDQIAYDVTDAYTGATAVWTLPVAQPAAARILAVGSRGSWSPNDSQIVYGNTGMIYRVNADGTGRVSIGAGFYPAWRR